MTPAATEFVGAITFEALTGRPVHTGLFDAGRALDHIALARAATAIVVAPATADFLARAAAGQADDLLAACLLAASSPVLLVPAMNDHMWAHPQTQRNVAHLRELGYRIIDPDEGMLAAGEGSGPGRMPEPEVLFAHVGRALETRRRAAAGKALVADRHRRTDARSRSTRCVSSSNHRYSGKMGVALAAAAWLPGRRAWISIAEPRWKRIGLRQGPDVTVAVRGVHGGHGGRRSTEFFRVTRRTSSSWRRRRARIFGRRTLRPRLRKSKKGTKSPTPIALTCDAFDISRWRPKGARRPGSVVVGFALETDDAVSSGRKKLEAKDLDMIVVNDVTEEGAARASASTRIA